MSLLKRGNIWWVRITHNGRRIQESTKTADKQEAQEYHDRLKSELWRVKYLNEKPNYTWNDAVVRWCKEQSHKKSLKSDLSIFKWLDPHLNGWLLKDINRTKIDNLTAIKESVGAKNATTNRMLALIRSVLRRAEREWEWIDRAPVVRLKKEDNKRIRWLTRDEFNRLVKELPEHLKPIVIVAVNTGLRASNLTNLRWEWINLEKKHLYIPAQYTKSGRAWSVPLNNIVLHILQKLPNTGSFVFTYKKQPIRQLSCAAWRKALKRSEVKDFRFHDLRHTWASWHVQNGTSLHELQVLGDWSSFEMVLRYAHLSSKHLQTAVKRLEVENENQ